MPLESLVRDDVRVELPEIRYAWNGDDSLAYQVVGDGPVDLVYLQGALSNVALNWEHPACARFLRQLSRFSRLIVTDRRGLARSGSRPRISLRSRRSWTTCVPCSTRQGPSSQ
jgi:pimeloyl-ACP methyl ester carboxylesterase